MMNFNSMASDLGLDESDFRELAELLVQTSQSDLDRLQTAVDSQDFKAAAGAAHSIKGAAGNLGFQTLSSLARVVETQTRDSSLDGVPEAVATMHAELAAIASALETSR